MGLPVLNNIWKLILSALIFLVNRHKYPVLMMVYAVTESHWHRPQWLWQHESLPLTPMTWLQLACLVQTHAKYVQYAFHGIWLWLMVGLLNWNFAFYFIFMQAGVEIFVVRHACKWYFVSQLFATRACRIRYQNYISSFVENLYRDSN